MMVMMVTISIAITTTATTAVAVATSAIVIVDNTDSTVIVVVAAAVVIIVIVATRQKGRWGRSGSDVASSGRCHRTIAGRHYGIDAAVQHDGSCRLTNVLAAVGRIEANITV